MIATSIEQSKKLIELGLDPGTADMCYSVASEVKGEFWNVPKAYKPNKECGDMPCWSLAMLLELIPKHIWVKEEGKHGIYALNLNFESFYVAEYVHFNTFNIKVPDGEVERNTDGEITGVGSIHTLHEMFILHGVSKMSSTIDVVYEMFCWCMENGYKEVNLDEVLGIEPGRDVVSLF